MNKKIQFTLFSLFLIITNISAQKSTVPSILWMYGPINVSKPILLDSADVNGKKYSNINLLSSFTQIPEQESFGTSLSPDSGSVFTLPKSQDNGIYLVSFYLSNNKFGKGKLELTSPNPFEIYIDDAKKTSKDTEEDSLKSAKPKTVDLKGNLDGDRIVIKFLVSGKNTPQFKLTLTPDKKDTTFLYSTNNSPKRRIKIEDILIGNRVYNSYISPNGKYVLLRFASVNDKGEKHQTIQIYDVKNGKIILDEDDNRKMLNWMPKTDKLYFFEDDYEGMNMYLYDPATSEKTILAKKLPKENYFISPDGKMLFYSDKETLEEKIPDGLIHLLSPEDRQSYYRNRYQIYKYDLATGVAQQLTFGKNSSSVEDISKDGNLLLFTTRTEDLSKRPFSKTSLYLLNLATMKVETIKKDLIYFNNALFSPDSKKLLIAAAPETFGQIGIKIDSGQVSNSYDTQAYILDLYTKDITAITRDFNPSIAGQWWNHSDNLIYFKVEDKDYENIYSYNPDNKKYNKLPLSEELIRDIDFANNTSLATYVGSGVHNSFRAYLLNLKNLKSKEISAPFKDNLSKLELGEVKEWDFVSENGDTIQGRYYLPPGFDPLKKYPVIVYYYGGTSPTQRTFESTYPLNVYTAMGYIVYVINPSGTTGFGQKFSARHVNAWGDYTADEIIEGTKKFAENHPYTKADKIACIGASYGGFMTQYLLTKTNIFACAISHAGISDITSYWGEGYWGYTYSATASANSYPWNNPELYTEHSPLFNADKINTPLLLLHGTADTNVPTGESIQMYTALKLLGKEVEFVEVKGEDHWILDFQKRINWNHTIYAWFAKWLKDDPSWWNDLYPADKK